MTNGLSLKGRLNVAIQKSEDVLTQPHVSAEVKSLVRELRDICDGYEAQAMSSKDGSADARFMKKKLEHATREQQKVESRFDEVKSSISEMVIEIKSISAEVAQILKRHDPSNGDDDCFSALKIKAATQKLAELIVKLSTPN